jgi:hypothetical protein
VFARAQLRQRMTPAASFTGTASGARR